VPPPRRESPNEERLEPKKEEKETRKEGEEEMPETQDKGEQEEGRERSRRAAAVKATQTLQANESVSVAFPGGAQDQGGWLELGLGVWEGGQNRNMTMIVIIVARSALNILRC
jgi:hypothetical protein